MAVSQARRIALIGVGRWGRHVLRDLRTLGCEVWAVTRSPESTARATEGRADAIVPTVEALPPVHGAVVCTTTSSHADVVDAVRAAHDVPVFVEKPLTADPASARRLAEAHAGRLFVMDKWRYHPCVEELARIARSGELGPVRALHSRRVTRGHRYTDVDTVWVHAPHDLAIALEVLGELPRAEHAVEEWVGDERVSLIGALGGVPRVTLEVSCVAPDHRRELRLVCEGGVAYIDGGWPSEVHVVRDLTGDAPPESRATPGELPLLAELRAFVEHLDGGPPPRSSAAEGAETVTRIAELGALAARERVTA
jgi:predicted dehydrogenase